MKQAVGLRWENGAMNPGRLPWAGMKQAVGLKGNGVCSQTRMESHGGPYMRRVYTSHYKRRSNAPLVRLLKKSVLRPLRIVLRLCRGD